MRKARKLKICNEAVEHWMQNLLFAHAGMDDHVEYRGEYCSFCQSFAFPADCLGCPMISVGQDCNNDNSAWDKVVDAFCSPTSRMKRIKACEHMLRVVERASDVLLRRRD
jgi:hypothetical protein